MIIPLTEIFCEVDDFYRTLEAAPPPALRPSAETVNPAGAVPPCTLAPSEMLTLVSAFHLSNYRTFKHFYAHVPPYWRAEFPGLVSDPRLVALPPSLLIPLCASLNGRKGTVTGMAFIDSTSLAVCHHRRIHSHRVFKQLATRGPTSVDWFYGFKLHLMVNDRGEGLAIKLPTANVDDREPVPERTRGLWGKRFGDQGYLSQKRFDLLFDQHLPLITKIKKNMKNKRMPLMDKLLLRKRAMIETVNDQLKNISPIEPTRHRSIAGFMLNLLGGLMAYTYRDKKPSLHLDMTSSQTLPVII